jgi:hypothetical protein
VTRLAEFADVVKSANAGATWLTLDIGFRDRSAYEHAIAAPTLRPDAIAAEYRVPAAEVAVYHCHAIRTIKVTLPRAVVDGGAAETDFDGTQQFIPLLDLEV